MEGVALRKSTANGVARYDRTARPVYEMTSRSISFKRVNELWQAVVYGVPQNVAIHIEVDVHNAVPHRSDEDPGDILPSRFRGLDVPARAMPPSKSSRSSACRAPKTSAATSANDTVASSALAARLASKMRSGRDDRRSLRTTCASSPVRTSRQSHSARVVRAFERDPDD